MPHRVPAATMWPMRKWVVRIAIAAGALFLLIQAVPYGRSHSNPPVTAEPAWNSPQTRALARESIFDCHSNQTKWPWYTNVAPVSWLTQSDVDGGRSSLNFSEWDKPQDVSAGDIAEAVNGGMPPWFYVLIHPHAGLSKSEKAQLVAGLQATLAKSPPKGGAAGSLHRVRLYSVPISTNVERVTLALAHKGLSVEHVEVPYDDRSEILRVSGQELVPVLVTDGEVVSDSTVILEWLETRFPEPPLFPAEPARRAEAMVFVDWFNRVWKRAPNVIATELEGARPTRRSSRATSSSCAARSTCSRLCSTAATTCWAGSSRSPTVRRSRFSSSASSGPRTTRTSSMPFSATTCARTAIRGWPRGSGAWTSARAPRRLIP